MRVQARHGDLETEAEITRDGDRVVVRIGDNEYAFTAQADHGGRVELEHEGHPLVVEVDGIDLRVDGMPYALDVRKAPPNVPGATRAGGGAGGVTRIKPPMPGKIVKVGVQAGDTVQPGTLIVVLEAMKMQNEIVSPVEGVVKSLNVEEGEAIDGKRVIAEIE